MDGIPIDDRIRVMIHNGVQTKKRSMFFIIGNESRKQVVNLHDMLTKDSQFNIEDNLLWCYKNSLGFSSNNVKDNESFEEFIVATNISYCKYHETHKVLGQTYSMCILQDFEGITPNLMAKTIETVEGSGLIIFLLKSMKSLRQISSMVMDCHSSYKSESQENVVGRFNERLVLSLKTCENCLVVNDEMKIVSLTCRKLKELPHRTASQFMSENDKKLAELKETAQTGNDVILKAIANCCKTHDQIFALTKFLLVIQEKNWNHTLSMTAARGRGKSASLGLAIAAAIAYGYPNILVTSPHPDNISTLFKFVARGFESLGYVPEQDFNLIQSTNPEFNEAIIRIDVKKDRYQTQTIRYIQPDADPSALSVCDLLVIDEAASIPLPLVQSLLGSKDRASKYLVFMASTVNGYEGTGRALSMKLITDLKKKSNSTNGRKLTEIKLEESVRYAPGDPIEKWLNDLLCLDGEIPEYESGMPMPDQCELMEVDRDTLFSKHKPCEKFLKNMMSVFATSHYKNSPDDLQLLADAPNHKLFCLIPKVDEESRAVPDVFVAIQVCLVNDLIEEKSSKKSDELEKNCFGNQKPWKMSQQYSHLYPDFPQLTGARIVRIATHPDYQGMKYGKHAVGMLVKYFKGELVSIDEDSSDEEEEELVKDETPNTNVLLTETISPRRTGKPLFSSLTGIPPLIDWIGTSFGLTERLMKFWQFNGFSPVHVSRDKNQVTGEHQCVLINIIKEGLDHKGVPLQQLLFNNFSQKFLKSLRFREFAQFKASTGLQILVNKKSEKNQKPITAQEINRHILEFQVLSRYGRDDLQGGYKRMDYALNNLAANFFMNKLPVHISPFQKLILLGMGLQNKSVEIIANEYNDTVQSVLTQLRRLVKKLCNYMATVVDEHVAMELGLPLEREENDIDKKAEIESFKEDLKKKETLDMNLLGETNYDLINEEKIGKIESVAIKRSLNDNTNNIEIKKKKVYKKKKKNKKIVTATNVN